MNPRRRSTSRPAPRRRPRVIRPTMADLADPHDLYQKSVQSPDHDVPFVAAYFKQYTGRPLRILREDFCGAAAFAAHFVTRHRDNRAVGVDLDGPTLHWGLTHNVARLTAGQRQRLTLIHGNVLDRHRPHVQLAVAMNFSYMVLKDRPSLLRYFKQARASLLPGGMFLLDIWGGSESQVLQEESRDVDNPDDDGVGDFTFIWDQDVFDPSTYYCTTRIHFTFRDKSQLRDAFVYDWRMWTIPEVTELLTAAGFLDVHFLWEGVSAKTGEGNGEYRRATAGDADLAWIAYIVGVVPATRV